MLGKRSRHYVDKEAERWKNYEDYIVSQSFQLYHVRGDGNCLFRSVAHQIEQDESKHSHYRKLAIDYMSTNPGKFISSLRSDEDGTWDQYLKRMMKNREWGGNLEILALSQALEVQIWLFQENFTILKIGSPEYDDDGILINSHFEDRPIVYLAYSRSERQYDSVVLNGTVHNTRIIRKVSHRKKQDPQAEIIENPTVKKKVIKQKKVTEDKNEYVVKRKVIKKTTKGETFNEKMIEEKEINFKDIFLLGDKELIYWCTNVKLLKKPNSCKSCRNKIRKAVHVRLAANKKYIDKYVWRCCDKDCGWTEQIRKGNRLFDEFPRVKLRLLLIYIFTHFTVLLSPVLSSQMLGMSLKTIRKLAMILSNWIIAKQLKTENVLGKFGGPDAIVEIDESCFFKRKYNKGRAHKQVWGFGIVERYSGRFFIEIVPTEVQRP